MFTNLYTGIPVDSKHGRLQELYTWHPSIVREMSGSGMAMKFPDLSLMLRMRDRSMSFGAFRRLQKAYLYLPRASRHPPSVPKLCHAKRRCEASPLERPMARQQQPRKFSFASRAIFLWLFSQRHVLKRSASLVQSRLASGVEVSFQKHPVQECQEKLQVGTFAHLGVVGSAVLIFYVRKPFCFATCCAWLFGACQSWHAVQNLLRPQAQPERVPQRKKRAIAQWPETWLQCSSLNVPPSSRATRGRWREGALRMSRRTGPDSRLCKEVHVLGNSAI